MLAHVGGPFHNALRVALSVTRYKLQVKCFLRYTLRRMKTSNRRGRPPVETPKTSTSFRLSETGRTLIAELSQDTGLSQASVVEMAVRDMAKARGVDGSHANANGLSPMARALAMKPVSSSGPVDAVADLEELRATRTEELAR